MTKSYSGTEFAVNQVSQVFGWAAIVVTGVPASHSQLDNT